MPAVADGDARSRIAPLKERALGRDRDIAALQTDLAHSEAKLTRLGIAGDSRR
jgi:hypothetical protein